MNKVINTYTWETLPSSARDYVIHHWVDIEGLNDIIESLRQSCAYSGYLVDLDIAADKLSNSDITCDIDSLSDVTFDDDINQFDWSNIFTPMVFESASGKDYQVTFGPRLKDKQLQLRLHKLHSTDKKYTLDSIKHKFDSKALSGIQSYNKNCQEFVDSFADALYNMVHHKISNSDLDYMLYEYDDLDYIVLPNGTVELA